MTPLQSFLGEPIVQRIGWALVHSAWQDAALAIMLAAALLLLRRRSAQAQYVTACVTLLLMAVLPALTAAFVQVTPAPPLALPTPVATPAAPAMSLPPPAAITVIETPSAAPI